MKINKGLLALTFAVLSLNACKKSETISTHDLYGTWVRETAWDDGLTLHVEQTFKTDNTLEIVTTFNSANKVIFGYSSEQNGRFSIKSDSVITELIEGKQLNEYPLSLTGQPLPFSARKDDLKYFKRYYLGAAKVIFSKDRNEVSFIGPPCPPNAACANTLQFKRLQ